MTRIIHCLQSDWCSWSGTRRWAAPHSRPGSEDRGERRAHRPGIRDAGRRARILADSPPHQEPRVPGQARTSGDGKRPGTTRVISLSTTPSCCSRGPRHPVRAIDRGRGRGRRGARGGGTELPAGGEGRLTPAAPRDGGRRRRDRGGRRSRTANGDRVDPSRGPAVCPCGGIGRLRVAGVHRDRRSDRCRGRCRIHLRSGAWATGGRGAPGACWSSSPPITSQVLRRSATTRPTR